MIKSINDLQLEKFINERQKFGSIKYPLISESLLFDRVNNTLIQNCSHLLDQLNSQNAKDPLSAAIQKILYTNNPENNNTDSNIPPIEVKSSEIFESAKWQVIKQDYSLLQFVHECLKDKINPRQFIDLDQINTISLELSIEESKKIAQNTNMGEQKKLILQIIEQQAEANIDSFLTRFTTQQEKQKEKQTEKYKGNIKISIKKKQNSTICEQIAQKLTKPHQVEKQQEKDKLQSIILVEKVDLRQNEIIPLQEYNNLFQNQNKQRLDKIREINQTLIKQRQSISYSDIQKIYSQIQDPKIILNEILLTLDLALSITVWDEALQKYCKSIIDDDSKKQQALNNVQESCEQVIQQFQQFQFQQFSIKDEIKYFDFNTEQNNYQNYLKDHKPNETPKKYKYEIDNKGIQMYSDDLNNNKSIYISVSFNQYEQKVRGILGNSIIDEHNTMLRISFVQINEFKKLVQSVINKNDVQTKLLVKCLMISASSLIHSFTKNPVISQCLEKNKKLQIDFKLPKDDNQINDLMLKIQQQK